MLFIDNLFSKSKNTTTQFIRYIIAGGISGFFDLSALYTLTEYYKIHYLISAIVGFIFGVAINYTLSKLWIFSENKYNATKEFILFVIIGVIGLFLNEFIIWILSDIFLLWYVLSKIIAIFAIFLWNFSARKYLLFTKKHNG